MKVIFAMALLAMAGCNNADKTTELSMTGAYKMTSQNLKNANIDSTITTREQLKIYTDDYMMFAAFNTSDSTSSFGIATYSTNKDTLTESLLYYANDTTIDQTATDFKLLITKTAQGFKQVIPDIEMEGQKSALTETYDSAGTATTSPLDGAWKLTNSYATMGKDSFPNMITQYKVYGSGHFIFGHSRVDSANNTLTGMGYGKFTMTGNNKSTETVQVSSYAAIRGQVIDIDIEMNGTDEYKQSFTTPDGYRLVEIYQRLKK